jgi:hypothetical protein
MMGFGKVSPKAKGKIPSLHVRICVWLDVMTSPSTATGTVYLTSPHRHPLNILHGLRPGWKQDRRSFWLKRFCCWDISLEMWSRNDYSIRFLRFPCHFLHFGIVLINERLYSSSR